MQRHRLRRISRAISRPGRQRLRRELAARRDRLDGIDAVFVPGGTGPMEDLYDDPGLGRILAALQARTAPVATVCHGTIGLLSARSGGAWLFAGYQMTGYTDEEESQGAPGDAAPFTLESRLRAEGANFTVVSGSHGGFSDTSDVSNRIVAFINAHAAGQRAVRPGRPPATKS
jgi:putative intracellular protease/amidase